MAFTLMLRARLLLEYGYRRGRLRFMLRTARLLPQNGLSTSGFDADRFPSTPPIC